MDQAMKESKLDLIAFPMDSPCPRIAAAAGRLTLAAHVGQQTSVSHNTLIHDRIPHSNGVAG